MEEKDKIKEQVDLTMESLEGISHTKANPFLFNKILNRMNEPFREKGIFKKGYSLSLKYVIGVV